jgi:hypothetical protein
MKRMAYALLISLAACFVRDVSVFAAEPWEVNTPIVQVKKELYQPHPRPNVILWLWTYYIGPNLELEESYVEESAETGDDVHINPRRRYSTDDGRTWTAFEPWGPIDRQIQGVKVQFGRMERAFVDPVTGVTIRTSQYLIHKAYPFNTLWESQEHMFYRLSLNAGKTYGPPKQLRYEAAGDPYDLNNPFNESCLRYNQGDPGNNIIRHSNGTVILGAGNVMVPYGEADGTVARKPLGSLCMVGKWNSGARDYDWKAGKPVWVPMDISARGLMEPEVAELADGRVLITWRTDYGRRFYGLSTDGGFTVSEPKELKYDDGSRFYSPSSISNMLRHNVTKKLYWIGNISTVPPRVNLPRYPLVIAEIDETIPALKRNTVTEIDTRQPGEGETIQFSNYSLMENRRTHEVEIYLSPMGVNPKSIYEAGVRRYTLTFP